MATAPVLKIGDMEFELEQSFSDGYRNDIRPPGEMTHRCHPTHFIWTGGEFTPLNIAINLAVGVQSALTTPQTLRDALRKFYRYCIPSNPVTSKPPEPVVISLGDWYKKVGYMGDLNVTYMEPWDIETSMPMRAEVRFTFIIDYLAFIPAVKGQKSAALLPSSSNWDFNFTVGSRQGGR